MVEVERHATQNTTQTGNARDPNLNDLRCSRRGLSLNTRESGLHDHWRERHSSRLLKHLRLGPPLSVPLRAHRCIDHNRGPSLDRAAHDRESPIMALACCKRGIRIGCWLHSPTDTEGAPANICQDTSSDHEPHPRHTRYSSSLPSNRMNLA